MSFPSKILFITDNYPPVFGGVANSAARIIGSISEFEKSTQITVLTIGRQNKRIQVAREDGINICRVGFQKNEQKLLHELKTVGSKLVVEFEPELIIGFYIYRSGFIATLLGNQFDIATLLSIRGNDIELSPYKNDRFGKIQFALDHCSGISSVSTDLLEKASAISPSIMNKPHKVVFNGIQTNSVKSDQRNLVEKRKEIIKFGFLGDDRKKKGLDLFMNAFLLLVNKMGPININPEIVIAGNINSKIIKHSKLKNLNKVNIAFLGQLDHSNIDNFFDKIDILVLPSRWDGFPNVLLESVSRKIPVIMSDIDNFKEFYPDHILFFEANNYISLTRIYQDILFGTLNLNEITTSAEQNYSYLKDTYTREKEFLRWKEIIEQLTTL